MNPSLACASPFVAYLASACLWRYLFFLSVTPFCQGMLGQVNWHHILCAYKYLKNSFNVYFPPLSIRRHLILCPTSLSTLFLNSLDLSSASDFSFIKSTQTYLEKSLIKVIMYLYLLIDGCFTFLKTLECLSSSGSLALNLNSKEGSWYAFPYWHPPQTMLLWNLKLWKTFHHRLLHHRL